MKLHDISPLISPRLAVWPGDTPVSREILADIARGDHLTLSTLHATVHLGAHADAPSHYGNAPTIDESDLSRYVGECQVVRVEVSRSTRITPTMIQTPILSERVLLATGSYPDAEVFNTDFAALSVELVGWLVAQGVRLIGIDTPSVDLFDCKDLQAHQACLRGNVAILEGLVMRDIVPGTYELIALPLRLEGFDASPVRAVLREMMQ
jgi:arylformamidase